MFDFIVERAYNALHPETLERSDVVMRLDARAPGALLRQRTLLIWLISRTLVGQDGMSRISLCLPGVEVILGYM